MKKPIADEEFLKRFADFEMEDALEFIRSSIRTGRELRQAIGFLIEHREHLKDEEITMLQEESESVTW